jgi:N4-gp56 family major capsid protein
MPLPTSASVISSGLSAYASVYYDRIAIDTLDSNLRFYPGMESKHMPDMSGTAMQIFNSTALLANTNPATEGSPGGGDTLQQNVATINLANYVDYITYSNKVKLTAVSNEIAMGGALLAYRGALSVDTVISTAVDTQANSNAAVDDIEVANGAYLTAAIIRQAVWTLRSRNVHPKWNGLYYGISHSLTSYDVINDATAAGFTDLQVYSDLTAPYNAALAGIRTDGFIGNIGGCEFFESNAVPTEANWQSTGHTAYHTYLFGLNAFIVSSLGKTDLAQRNFQIITSNYPSGSNSLDPGGLIYAASAYNFFFGCVAAPNNGDDRFRRIRSESSIG